MCDACVKARRAFVGRFFFGDFGGLVPCVKVYDSPEGCHLACHKTISFVFVYLLMNSNNMVNKHREQETITSAFEFWVYHTHLVPEWCFFRVCVCVFYSRQQNAKVYIFAM